MSWISILPLRWLPDGQTRIRCGRLDGYARDHLRSDVRRFTPDRGTFAAALRCRAQEASMKNKRFINRGLQEPFQACAQGLARLGRLQPARPDPDDGRQEAPVCRAKDGHLYGFDRATNGLLYRVPVTQVEDVAETFSPGEDVHFCPGATGGTEWNSPAYDPQTNLILVG